MADSTRRRVSYFYDYDVGNFYYAQGHPMKPHRVRMTHNLLAAYGLIDYMDVLSTPHASEEDMTRFHGDEYINFLRTITPDTALDHSNVSRFNVLEDCPVFDGLWEYCQIAAGGSLAGAARLNSGEADVAMNWAGGLHHAKKVEASGFCYINDCVLGILELLKVHARVLYVDIDIHHGDGVEEAFYCTDRVMTASFHKFGDYFPGTGDVGDIGHGKGKHYSVNFPLLDGIDDESYREVFVPVMTRVMEWYQPGAVLLQCGADSLAGDRLGCFNLSLRGHGQCVDFFKKYDVPLLLLGGGGYTIRNVSRCWAYETSRVLNIDLPDQLPHHDNYEFHGPDFRLHIQPSNMENHNTRASLERTKIKLFESLRMLPHAPSIPFRDVPRASPLGVDNRKEETDITHADVRERVRGRKSVVEYEDSDDEFGDDEYVGGLAVARRRFKRNNFMNHDTWAPLPASKVPIPEKNGRLSPPRNVPKAPELFEHLSLQGKQNAPAKHLAQRVGVQRPVGSKPILVKRLPNPVRFLPTLPKPALPKPALPKPVVHKSSLPHPVVHQPTLPKPLVQGQVVHKPFVERSEPVVSKPSPPSTVPPKDQDHAPTKPSLPSDPSIKSIRNTSGRISAGNSPKHIQKGDEERVSPAVVNQKPASTGQDEPKKMESKAIPEDGLREHKSLSGAKRPRSMSLNENLERQSSMDAPLLQVSKKSRPTPVDLHRPVDVRMDSKKVENTSDGGRNELEKDGTKAIKPDPEKKKERQAGEKESLFDVTKKPGETTNIDHKPIVREEKKIEANGQSAHS